VNITINYTSGGSCPQVATCDPQGDGCVAEFDSFYEVMTAAAFDMNGKRLTGINTAAFPASQYSISISSSTRNPIGFFGPASVVPLGDDQVLPAGTLGLEVSSNGVIYNLPGGSASFAPSIAAFLDQPTGGWFSWTDMQPNAAGSGQIWYEETGTIAQITFDGVYGWNTTDPNFLQFVINTASGDFEITWGATGLANPEDWLVGVSPTGPSLDPGPDDLSTSPPNAITTSVFDSPPLTLACLSRPVQDPTSATPFCVETQNITPGSQIHFGLLGVSRPGLSLGFLGFPLECTLWSSGEIISAAPIFGPGTTLQWCPLVLPPLSAANFSGFQFEVQAVTLLGPPLFGLQSRASNGLKCVVGSL